MGASLGVDSIRWRPIILLDNTLKRHESKLQGDEKKIRALGSSTIGWRPVVIVKNTSRWHTCRHHLGVASRNGERAKNLISLVKIYGKYYPGKTQITSIIIKIIFNLTSRLNCKHTLHYQGCRKKNTNSMGIKLRTLVLIFVITWLKDEVTQQQPLHPVIHWTMPSVKTITATVHPGPQEYTQKIITRTIML